MPRSALRRRVSVGDLRPSQEFREAHAFDVHSFLSSAGLSRTIAKFHRCEIIYSQGDPAKDVMFIRDGSIKRTVVNAAGQEAVLAISGHGDFLGETCLTGQLIRTATATAISPTTVLVIEKNEMIRVLHGEHELSDRFIAYLLARNTRAEEDLTDQLFNSTEKRLARALLLLARYGDQDRPGRMLLKVTQEMLAEMIGSTRSRTNLFMNKFRKLGFIEYGGRPRGLQVNKSLLRLSFKAKDSPKTCKRVSLSGQTCSVEVTYSCDALALAGRAPSNVVELRNRAKGARR
jgi:CRP/FNR family transcriptional regulator, cyclic AMP receptor protein